MSNALTDAPLDSEPFTSPSPSAAGETPECAGSDGEGGAEAKRALG
jgi:hypothetical protein